MTELKCGRKQSSAKLTLFTKSPLPRGINAMLLADYGYQYKSGKALHTELSTSKFNTLKEKPGFRINIATDRVEIVHQRPYKTMPVPYWNQETLRKAFLRKYPDKLLYVKADSKGRGVDTYFHYNEAYLLSGFSFKRFAELLSAGDIVAEIRIGQYPDGRAHDHGTGFRIPPHKLDLCFDDRKQIL